jgi:hypothetical protein
MIFMVEISLFIHKAEILYYLHSNLLKFDIINHECIVNSSLSMRLLKYGINLINKNLEINEQIK